MSLPDLLLKTIPAFMDSARSLRKGISNPQDFQVRFRYFLTLITSELEVILSGRIPEPNEQILLEEVAELLDHLVQEKVVSATDAHLGGSSHIMETPDIAHRDYPRLSILKDLPHPGRSIRFSDNKDDQEYLLGRIRRCSHGLTEGHKRSNLQDFVSEAAKDELPQEMLNEANRIQELLRQYWTCDCTTPSRTVHLNLASLRLPREEDGTTKFEVLFSGPGTSLKWQEGEILVRPAEGNVVFEANGVVARVPRETNLVTACVGGKPTGPSTICHFIKRGLKSTLRLSMEIEQKSLLVDKKAHAKQLFVNAGRGVPLSTIPSLISEKESQVTRRDINGLSLVLAYALLQLYDEDTTDGLFYWLNPHWQTCHRTHTLPKWTNYVNFHYHGKLKPGKLDFQRPYLSSTVSACETQMDLPFDDINEAQHQAPSILALGKILLEMQLLQQGLKIDLEPEGEDSDSDEEGGENINSDYTHASCLLEQYQDRLDPWYVKAIDACLNPDPAEEMDIRQYIYRRIVRPLEHNYYFNSAAIENAQKQLDELKTNPIQVTVPASATYDEASEGRPSCLYGDDDGLPMNDERIEQASQWFEWMQDVHSRLSSGSGSDERVKIAVIDTGVELSEVQRDIYNKNDDMQYKSWINGDEEGIENGKDDVGHGTHIATLLARIARNATIHVARVFKERKPNMATELKNVAQAIRYAVDIWKVDIIVMSFGFEEEQDSDIEEDSILKAIRHAYHSGISLFAAASNDGNNRPDHVCWPARALEVICVHSGTGTGQPSTFTPGPYDNQRIMVLGEWVKSAWPPRLRSPGNTKYMSGTSCATPIAAGIAAIVLDYAREKLPPERWKRLRRVDGMQRMFERMKDSRIEKYWWIRPWDFFQRNNTLEWIDNEIRKAIG